MVREVAEGEVEFDFGGGRVAEDYVLRVSIYKKEFDGKGMTYVGPLLRREVTL